MINHLPVFAPVIALILFGLALWKPAERGLLTAALVVLVLGGFGAGLSYLTGDRAADSLPDDIPGVSMKAMGVHEEGAEIGAIVYGALTLWAIWEGYRLLKQGKALSKLKTWLLVVATIFICTVMGVVALNGGLIHHPEIRPTAISEVPPVN